MRPTRSRSRFTRLAKATSRLTDEGFTVRVVPHHEDLAHPHATGLILWAH